MHNPPTEGKLRFRELGRSVGILAAAGLRDHNGGRMLLPTLGEPTLFCGYFSKHLVPSPRSSCSQPHSQLTPWFIFLRGLVEIGWQLRAQGTGHIVRVSVTVYMG